MIEAVGKSLAHGLLPGSKNAVSTSEKLTVFLVS
jgi:hypothetical protein